MPIYKGTERLNLVVFNDKPTGTEYTGNTNIIPDVNDVVISKDTYLPNDVTVSGDANLKPENIVSGKEIFGIQGTLSGGFPNGTEWTQNNIINRRIGLVYYANGVWITCIDYTLEGGSYYSIDGKKWRYSTSKSFTAIYYANGIWVAGSGGLYYSTDGKSWTQSNITSGSFWSVYNANGIWVAGYSSGSHGLYYSTDGKTWKQSNITSGSFNSIYNANALWVATSDIGLYYSTDGKNWTISNTFKDEFTGPVYYANGIWVTNYSYNGLYYSTNGKYWAQSNITSGTFDSIYNANGIWVAGGDGLYYSTDGKNWTQSNTTNRGFNCIYYANGIWVGADTGGLYYSTDGKTWSQSNITGEAFYSVYNANGIWVVGGDSGIYYSISWEPDSIALEPDPQLIDFWIGSTLYQAEEGMVWGEWTNSSYNTGGYTVNGSDQVSASNSTVAKGDSPADTTPTPVSIYDVIEANVNYMIKTGSGGTGK